MKFAIIWAGFFLCFLIWFGFNPLLKAIYTTQERPIRGIEGRMELIKLQKKMLSGCWRKETETREWNFSSTMGGWEKQRERTGMKKNSAFNFVILPGRG